VNNSVPKTDQGFSIISGVFTPAEIRKALQMLSVADLDRTKAGPGTFSPCPSFVNWRSIHGWCTSLGSLSASVRRRSEPLFSTSPATLIGSWPGIRIEPCPLKERIEAPEWGPWSNKAGVLYAHAPAWALEQVVALRVSLDDSLTTNGPLRVLPNTHRRGVLSEQEIEQLARETLAVECTAASGGVVAMSPLTLHASSKAVEDRPRRILHIEYASTISLAPGIELVVS